MFNIANREMQTKTRMKYHLTPDRMAIIKKLTNSKCWRGCVEKGNLLHCWWECKLVQPLWRTICATSLHPRPTLCDPMDCSPPGSSVHGILQARVLKRVAMPSSRGIFLTQVWNPQLLCFLHWPGDSTTMPTGKLYFKPNFKRKKLRNRHGKTSQLLRMRI